MDLQLNGRTALVTGGTRGIGRAIVSALAAEGAGVAFCARDAGEVEAFSAELTTAGTRTLGQVLDVADGDALHGWVDAAAEELGGLDIVVPNVSALSIGDEEDNWRASFEVDMLSTVRLVTPALPHLRRSDAGSIVTISSSSGREIDFAAGAYGTFKAALVHYTQGLARAVTFLAAPSSTFISGTNLVVDGALTRGVQL